MDPASGVALASVVIKGIVLIVIGIGGVLSLYLGWRLYSAAVSSPTSLELAGKELRRLKMRAAGPGVFFAFFGAALLAFVASRELSVESETGYSVGQASDAEVAGNAARAVDGGGQPPARPASPTDPSRSAGAPPPVAGAPSPRRLERPADRVAGGPACTAGPVRHICLVRRLNVRMSGGEELTASGVRLALSDAIGFLRRLDRSGFSDAEQARLDRSIEAMNEIGARAGEWPMPQ